MRISKEIKETLIKNILEIFIKLPEYNGKVHCNISISIEGDIILSFNDPIKRELLELFKKRYVFSQKNIRNQKIRRGDCNAKKVVCKKCGKV